MKAKVWRSNGLGELTSVVQITDLDGTVLIEQLERRPGSFWLRLKQAFWLLFVGAIKVSRSELSDQDVESLKIFITSIK